MMNFLRGVDKKEAATADVAVCARVADLVPIGSLHPDVRYMALQERSRSTREPCAGCGHEILCGPTLPPTVARRCTVCMADMQREAAKASGRR